MASGFGQFFLGTPQRIQQVERYTPEQTGALQQLLSQGLQGLQNPYQGFEPIAQRARSQFSQQTIPGLAERFTSSGSALSSPAFASQLGQAGAGLEEGLAALQSQYGQQNQRNIFDMLNMGLSPRYENIPLGAEAGLAQNILPTLARLGGSVGAAGLSGMGQQGGAKDAILNILKMLAMGI